jgi:hypothetical protein
LGVYAVVLVSAGVATRTVINRLSGLGLTGIVILKLYLFDVWQLSRPYQMSVSSYWVFCYWPLRFCIRIFAA